MKTLYLIFAGLLLWVVAVMGCSRKELIPVIPPSPTATLTPTVTVTPTPNKVVFVTASTYTGDTIASLAHADSLCNAEAAAAGRSGTFVAWMSVPGTNAIDRITGNGPWYTVDQMNMVFASKAAMSGSPSATIQLDPYGAFVYDSPLLVWTGTLQGGTVGTSHCNSWTAGSGTTGTVGNASFAIGTQWSAYVNYADCGTAYRMYCFEQ